MVASRIWVDLESFERAVAHTDAYDADIRRAADGRAPAAIALGLLVDDVRVAADALRPVYDRTGGDEGCVSVVPPPVVLRDPEATVVAAAELWARCDRPNVLIEVPATDAGLRAARMLLIEGVGVVAAHVFSLHRCRGAAEAYLSALEARLSRGGTLAPCTGATSVPVGWIGAARAGVICRELERLSAGPRWERLAVHGARPQRCVHAGAPSERPALGLDLDELEHQRLRALTGSYRRLLAAIEDRIAASGWDRVSVASEESFPASDPPGWAGHALGPQSGPSVR